jgi:hypothetical protein
MLIANGGPGDVWSKTIAVAPGADYALRFWGASLNDNPNPGVIQAFINGAPVGGVLRLSDTGGVWELGGGAWASDALTTFATLTLVDENDAVQWNDFALDDISLIGGGEPPPQGVPEPSAWSLIMLGVAVVGGALRAARTPAKAVSGFVGIRRSA